MVMTVVVQEGPTLMWSRGEKGSCIETRLTIPPGRGLQRCLCKCPNLLPVGPCVYDLVQSDCRRGRGKVGPDHQAARPRQTRRLLRNIRRSALGGTPLPRNRPGDFFCTTRGTPTVSWI